MIEAAAKGKHRIRENIDALAIAVLMAVLMKYFAVEAYQIPTSSMQPVMMGSKAAGVTDRILVDKSRYILPWNDPERWDVVVFRYPLRRTQPYVKRVVGLPGDRLRIAGGNIYRVKDGGDPANAADLEIQRRPAEILAGHWRNLYPRRAELHGEESPLGSMFIGSGGQWDERDGALVVEQRSDRARSTLTFLSSRDGGLINRVYDGYPAWVARKMIEVGEEGGSESVQDVRVAFAVTPTSEPGELRVELGVNHGNSGGGYTFALVTAGGEGRLVVERGGDEAASSEPFPLQLSAGTTTELRFTHVDDRCIAEVDGEEVMTLDCTAFPTLAAIAPTGQGDRGKVVLRIRAQGGGELTYEDLRVERDLHYLPSSGLREGEIRVFEVPEDHYFMMGDNTQQSVDSRDWTAITVGMTDNGRLVDPDVHPDARRLRGNLRATSLQAFPDPDENPVVVMGDKKIVFTDENGQTWTLDGEALMDTHNNRVYDNGLPWFASPEGGWSPVPPDEPLDYEHFVPRKHIIGRPLLTFFRSWPWAWFHAGFIR